MGEHSTYVPGVTESVCPVCFARIGARRTAVRGDVFLVKQCPDHGGFETVIWRGGPSMNGWRRPKQPVHPAICYSQVDRGCPFDCGLCGDHVQLPCSVLLEVTGRCNLKCPVCFADSGADKQSDPDLDTIAFWFRRAIDAAGSCNVQLSGGEPTLRDDLPEIVRIGRKIGFSFIQVIRTDCGWQRTRTLRRH
jgi:7,8-dihydro-6-hydroxymethylpterin dimethyltransferase